MYSVRELFRNDTALAAGLLTAITGFLTGPIFKMDPAAVGSIVGLLGLLLTVWVRSQVYSQKGAAKVATQAATDAVKAVSASVAGPPGTVTVEGAQAIQDAVQDAVPGTAAPEVAPTVESAPVQDDRPVNEAGEALNKDGTVSKRQPTAPGDPAPPAT